LDGIERRLREVIAIVDHEPLRGYSVLRAEKAVSLYTSTTPKLSKMLLVDLTNGVWPGWCVIVNAVPELTDSRPRFDSSELDRSVRQACARRIGGSDSRAAFTGKRSQSFLRESCSNAP
jgi:hypothetical protein